MCLLLADFLRETLALGARKRIPLSASWPSLARSLVEQVRFGARLRSRVDDHNGGADDVLVPPLVLQPLVENAVTHGIAHVLEGGVLRIRVDRRVATLVVTVDNPSDPERPAGRGTGLGLRNVRERLESLYGDDAMLQTEEKDGRFTARVTMPVSQ